MPKLVKSIKAEDIQTAAFDMETTLGNVRFLMEQMNDPESFRLTRVDFPAGGGRVFEIPNMTDEPEAVTSIEGIIVHHQRLNAYWVKEYGDGPTEPPMCESTDGISGIDQDGCETLCRFCPKNRLGTAIKGRGKACKNMRRLLILREGDAAPLELCLPPTSIANFGTYVQLLAPRRLRPQDVVTRIKLACVANGEGKDYSQAQFTLVGRVDSEAVQLLRKTMGFLIEPLPALLNGSETAELLQSA